MLFCKSNKSSILDMTHDQMFLTIASGKITAKAVMLYCKASLLGIRRQDTEGMLLALPHIQHLTEQDSLWVWCTVASELACCVHQLGHI